jgi:hypothetical protein
VQIDMTLRTYKIDASGKDIVVSLRDDGFANGTAVTMERGQAVELGLSLLMLLSNNGCGDDLLDIIQARPCSVPAGWKLVKECPYPIDCWEADIWQRAFDGKSPKVLKGSPAERVVQEGKLARIATPRFPVNAASEDISRKGL